MTFKKIALCVGFALCTVFGYSQDVAPTKGKPNVFVEYFSRPNNIPFALTEALRARVLEGLIATNRVEIIDVDSKESLRVEKARRESGSLSAGDDIERLKVMVTEGANYIIQGRITNATAEKRKLSDGSIYYAATCSYTLKVINPNNGKLVTTMNFKPGSGLLETPSGATEMEAAIDACKYVVKEMREFVEKTFPIQGTILEIAIQKKNKAKEVYISIGSDNGVGPKTQFEVCIERTIAGGRTSNKVIGRLKVKDIEGGDLTLCEVKDGEEEIKAAMDAGQTVTVRSIYRKTAGDVANGIL